MPNDDLFIAGQTARAIFGDNAERNEWKRQQLLKEFEMNKAILPAEAKLIPATERAALAAELKLRYNRHTQSWEVYSRIFLQVQYKWITISLFDKNWYVTQFNPPIVEFDSSVDPF